MGLSNHYKYYMYVSEEAYFPFVIFGILAFWLGTLIIKRKNESIIKEKVFNHLKVHLQNKTYFAYWIIGLGWVCSILQNLMPASLRFIFYLLANSMYVGVIYLLFNSSNAKWGLIGFILFLLFASSLQRAMFHGLLLWLTFISLYFFALKNYSFGRKLLFLIIGIAFVYIIQIVKWEIRSGKAQGNISGFFGVVSEKVLSDEDYDETNSSTEDFVVRLNQGWIISRIMYNIPANAPFVDGETVNNAMSATLLPRFLNPDKTNAGGKEYFEQFTGFSLLPSTSMGASLIGEGYANYGYFGSIIFMFIIGLFYRFVLNITYSLLDKYPTLLLWLPLIFLQVVKAESDLLRVMNHLVKASILVFVIYWLSYKVFKWRI
jgi:hypothetical protein